MDKNAMRDWEMKNKEAEIEDIKGDLESTKMEMKRKAEVRDALVKIKQISNETKPEKQDG